MIMDCINYTYKKEKNAMTKQVQEAHQAFRAEPAQADKKGHRMRPAEFLAGSEAEVLKILKDDYTESQLVGVIIYPTRYEKRGPDHAIVYKSNKDRRAFYVEWIESKQGYEITIETAQGPAKNAAKVKQLLNQMRKKKTEA